jgi:RNA polymerase sigma-70 factor (ECF subfamily)
VEARSTPLVMAREPKPRHAPLDDAEFERRLRAHAPGVAALLRRRVKSADLRGDALQEALARAWRARARYDPARPLGAWLATVALRVACELERGRRRRPDGAEWDGEAEDRAAGEDDDDPALAIARKEEIERASRAIATLEEIPRRIVLRFHRDGASVQEIATEMGMPANTVKSHLRRARQRLARELGAGP